jgi:CheY-like chemotaxis protein
MTWNILITDDDPIIRKIVRLTLECNGHAVIEAVNGEEAIAAAQNHCPDLIIMDVMMPVMDGLTACSTLKNSVHTGDIPIIILSTNASASDKSLGYKAGADMYLQKPVIPSKLNDTINHFLTKN